jgi:hypothetical protein
MKTHTPIVAGCVALAALVFAAPKSASATIAAAPPVQYGETHAGLVQEVGRRYYRRRYVRPYYSYRPYYGYGYGYRPYYRPYGYYGYGYWRPGISFGFSF